MVESEAQELPEDVMLGAVTFGHESFQPVIQAIIELAEHAAKEPWALPEPSAEAQALKARVDALARAGLADAYREPDKAARARQGRCGAQADGTRRWPPRASSRRRRATLFHDLEADIVRNAILDTGMRIDGRDTKTVRPIVAEVGILPRAHGSALFTRGETQAFCVATLGTGQDEQIIDALEGEYREHFMLHYNFPPYSVGEAGRMGSPGRREVGHGKLAWRAIHPLLPEKEKFPYTLRVVSEITESNGSSSMATVCGGSLALMDAGVPLKRPVAGIAMGLIKEDRGFAVLSDILGDEDHLGDMDFKVAGTEDGDHRAADGHQDHLDHAGDHAHRPGAGARRPDAHPGRDGQGDDRPSRRRRRHRAAHHHHQRAEGEDPRGDRHRRQGDPRDRRADQAARSTSRTTARSRSPPPTLPRRSRRSTGSAASWRSRRSASSTTARW